MRSDARLASYVQNGVAYIGGAGNDSISGTDQSDVLYGNNGQDILRGGAVKIPCMAELTPTSCLVVMIMTNSTEVTTTIPSMVETTMITCWAKRVTTP